MLCAAARTRCRSMRARRACDGFRRGDWQLPAGRRLGVGELVTQLGCRAEPPAFAGSGLAKTNEEGIAGWI
jgi:hypothetical protein